MAFDFPNSPTEGQKYTPVVGGPTYTYKAPVWELVTTAGIVISDIPPPSPQPGATWWESDSGASYVYYDDGNTQQWVQTNSVGLAEAPIDGSSYARRNAAWINVSTQLTAQTRNRIVNPAMQISQENGNTALTTNGAWPADQWSIQWASSGTYTSQRVQVATPNGSKDRLRLTVTVADAALAAGDILVLAQDIEGSRVADFRYGSASAKQSILRFGFKAPAGTYSIAFKNGAVNRAYVANFTVAAGQANADTEQTFVIPGDTTGTWLTDTGVGLSLRVVLAAGTTYQGALGWQAGNLQATASNANGMATAGAVFELFDVGLYLDPSNTGVPPRWETPDEADELMACQRYWNKIAGIVFGGYSVATGACHATTYFPCQMRVFPATATSAVSNTNCSGPTASSPTPNNIDFYVSVTATGMYSTTFTAAFSARM